MLQLMFLCMVVKGPGVRIGSQCRPLSGFISRIRHVHRAVCRRRVRGTLNLFGEGGKGGEKQTQRQASAGYVVAAGGYLTHEPWKCSHGTYCYWVQFLAGSIQWSNGFVFIWKAPRI